MTVEEKEYQEFLLNQKDLIWKSKFTGWLRRKRQVLGLEIEGLQDIAEYLPEDARKAVMERVFRMKQYLEED